MVGNRPDYLSYLLRLWLARERGRPVWQASVQSPHTGERESFCTMEDLFVFLQRQTGTGCDADEDEHTTGQHSPETVE